VHNEGHQRPLHGGGIRRGQQRGRHVRRPVDEKLAVLGRRHHRTDGFRLHLRRQVHRLGRVTVIAEKEGKNIPAAIPVLSL